MEYEWMILNTNGQEVLWWSNEDGWVDYESADVFSTSEKEYLNLPVGGNWFYIPEAEVRQ